VATPEALSTHANSATMITIVVGKYCVLNLVICIVCPLIVVSAVGFPASYFPFIRVRSLAPIATKMIECWV
jgi:hypothetical protein